MAGTQLRGSFSEKLNAIKDEVKKAEGRVVVFIDELHTLVGAGATGDGPQDAANELKAAMSRGEFPCIGATTHDEFRKHIQTDPALERRFTPVVVNEPSVPDTVYILNGVIARYEEHHGLSYTPEALTANPVFTKSVTPRIAYLAGGASLRLRPFSWLVPRRAAAYSASPSLTPGFGMLALATAICAPLFSCSRSSARRRSTTMRAPSR